MAGGTARRWPSAAARPTTGAPVVGQPLAGPGGGWERQQHQGDGQPRGVAHNGGTAASPRTRGPSR
eukprot:12306280-Alexandrium_andersonii.AAC.1